MLFAQCNNTDQAEVHLKASTLVNESHTWYLALDYFSKILMKGRTEEYYLMYITLNNWQKRLSPYA